MAVELFTLGNIFKLGNFLFLSGDFCQNLYVDYTIGVG